MMQSKYATKHFIALLLAASVTGCVTTRVEDARMATTGIAEGDTVVILAKSYHLGNETEAKQIACVEDALARGAGSLNVIPHDQFIDSIFPWFEPRTAPSETKGLAALMARPGVAEKVAAQGVRYIVWLDGDTERVAGGGSLSCAVGPGGGGCFGFAWWQNDSDYSAAIWDLDVLQSAGTITADVSGTSFLPALVVPIPLIARTRAAACKGLANQLQDFLVGDEIT